MKWKNEKETLAEIKTAKGELEAARTRGRRRREHRRPHQDRRDALRHDPGARTRHRSCDETSQEAPADAPRPQRRDHRGRYRRRRLALDGRTGFAHARRRSRETFAHGRRPQGAHRRPRRSRPEGLRRHQALARGHLRPQSGPSDRSSSSVRPASARPSSRARSPNSSSTSDKSLIRVDMSEYMEKHSRLQNDRLAARLCRLRRRRRPHGARAPSPVLRHPLRRDREGASRSLQRASAGPRQRPPHRLQGSHGQLQELRHHHDEQHRRRTHRQDVGPRLR